MLVPLIRTLQVNFPKATITWVISRPAYDLVEGMEGIEFIVINKPNGLQDYWRFKKLLKRKQFDVLLATQASFRANLLYPLIKAKRKIGFDKIRAKDGHGLFVNETILPGKDHTLRSFLKFAVNLGIVNPKISWDLPIFPNDRLWAEEHIPPPCKNPLFLMNPAASKAERSLSSEKSLAILKHVKNKWQAHLILTGGPSDLDKSLGKEISQSIEVTNLIGKTKPKQLLAVIERVNLVVCPDTGPSHMAAAVLTPVIALHAVTSAEVSGPYTFLDLAIDYYPQAVKKFVGEDTKKEVLWGTHMHGKETMDLIPLEEILMKIDQTLTAQGFIPSTG